MSERRQGSHISDGAVKITREKWYQLRIENVLLKGLTVVITISLILTLKLTNHGSHCLQSLEI